MEYSAAASLIIRVNIKFNISFFFHSCKTFSLLIYVICCHTHVEVDFEVISVHVNTQSKKVLEMMLIQSFNHVFSVLFSASSNLHKLHLKSEIWSSHSVGEGVFYGPSVWPDIFALFPLVSRKANVNNLSVSAFAIRLPAPACHEICQCCTVMISIRVFICITVIKTFNVYVDLDP